MLEDNIKPDEGVQSPIQPQEGKTTCTYVVSPTGNDSDPGTETNPWGSFQYGLDSSSPGDTVCFREGVYSVEDTVRLSQSGKEDEPITFIAFPGEKPILDGDGVVGDLFIIEQGVSYLRVSGIEVRNYNYWGVSLDGDNNHIQLDHLIVIGGEAGIHFTYGDDEYGPPDGGPVDNITLEDSLIINSEYTGVDCTPGPCNNMIFRRLEIYGHGLVGEASWGADGLAIARGFPVLVENCYVHDNAGDGIDLNSRTLMVS